MSFIFGKAPQMPAPPKLEMPKVEDVPSYDDTARKEQVAAAEREAAIKRKGRRSTILTGTGLTNNPEIDTKTLLGA